MGLGRRLIPPVVVLLVAGGLLYYSQQKQRQATEEVQQAAQQLCEQVAQMPPGGALPPAARALQASLTTVEQLQTVLAGDAALHSLNIQVVTGDAEPPYGDGSATHQAYLNRHGATELVLRFHHPGDAQQMYLVGYWTP